jgi:hypothetical protein
MNLCRGIPEKTTDAKAPFPFCSKHALAPARRASHISAHGNAMGRLTFLVMQKN